MTQRFTIVCREHRRDFIQFGVLDHETGEVAAFLGDRSDAVDVAASLNKSTRLMQRWLWHTPKDGNWTEA